MRARVHDHELAAGEHAPELAKEDALWRLIAEVLSCDAAPEFEVLEGGRRPEVGL